MTDRRGSFRNPSDQASSLFVTSEPVELLLQGVIDAIEELKHWQEEFWIQISDAGSALRVIGI